MTSRPMTSSGVIRYTFGTTPITVSTPMPESQRRRSTSSSAFTVLPDIEGERAGLLDLLIVPALFLTMPAQHVELLGDLRFRAETAGVGVARNQSQGLPLAVASDHDRRMGSAQALWEVERPLQPVVLPLEGLLVAAPHQQGYLERLLEHLEPRFKWRERDAEAARLLFVVAGADAEPCAAPGEHVQRRHHLDEDGGVTEVHPRNHRCEPGRAGVGGQECQGCVALRLVGLGATHDRVLPEVVRHADSVEPAILGGTRDPHQRVTELRRSPGPVEAVELKS